MATATTGCGYVPDKDWWKNAIEPSPERRIHWGCAYPLAQQEIQMRNLQIDEVKFVSGGRGGGGAGGDRGQGTSSSASNNNNNNNNNGPQAMNAGGGPGNSGPGDKNSAGLGGGGVGPR
jgi:hypothetical protein